MSAHKIGLKLGQRGFTLIEMLISLAIFMVITGIVLYDYNNFNDDLIVSNLAYEVALEVRTAQVYGLSVLGTKDPTTNTDNFNAAYGVHLDSRDSQDFFLFIDSMTPADGELTYPGGVFTSDCGSGVNPECLEKVSLEGRNVIAKFCAVDSDTDNCPDFSPGSVNTLDITFKRPNPDASVLFSVNGGSPSESKNAKIYIESANGKTTKIVTVDQSGQISVQ